MIELNVTIFMCSHCTNVHNSKISCEEHEVAVHNMSTPPPPKSPIISEPEIIVLESDHDIVPDAAPAPPEQQPMADPGNEHIFDIPDDRSSPDVSPTKPPMVLPPIADMKVMVPMFGRLKPMYECPLCKDRKNGRSQMEIHLRVHTSERPFPCKLCTMKFASKSHLNSHFQSKHCMTARPRPFSCTHCDKKYGSKRELRVHNESAHGIVPAPKQEHICKYCQKQYAFANQLESHVRVHTGDKPYKCDKCIRIFSDSGNLKQHRINIHNVDDAQKNRFKCENCEQRTRFMSQMRQHSKTCRATKLKEEGEREGDQVEGKGGEDVN